VPPPLLVLLLLLQLLCDAPSGCAPGDAATLSNASSP
jgi:hypothetical protein